VKKLPFQRQKNEFEAIIPMDKIKQYSCSVVIFESTITDFGTKNCRGRLNTKKKKNALDLLFHLTDKCFQIACPSGYIGN
jgi:hypothetical protein